MSLFTSKTCRFWLLKPSFIATSFAWYFKIKKWTNNLRQNSQLFTPRVNSVYHWTESISFLEPKIWDLVPQELKSKAIYKQWQKLWEKLLFGQFSVSPPFPSFTMLRNKDQNLRQVLSWVHNIGSQYSNTFLKAPIIFCHWL